MMTTRQQTRYFLLDAFSYGVLSISDITNASLLINLPVSKNDRKLLFVSLIEKFTTELNYLKKSPQSSDYCYTLSDFGDSERTRLQSRYEDQYQSQIEQARKMAEKEPWYESAREALNPILFVVYVLRNNHRSYEEICDRLDSSVFDIAQRYCMAKHILDIRCPGLFQNDDRDQSEDNERIQETIVDSTANSPEQIDDNIGVAA